MILESKWSYFYICT